MEERVEISLLLDLYGALLTDKQRDIMVMYYNDDLSLSEIAELNETSRQAIYDLIKRCHKQLLSYEKRLTLLENSLKAAKMKEEIIYQLDKLKDNSKDDYETINNIKELINKAI